MATLTREQRKEIDEVKHLYEREVLDDAKRAIAGYMERPDKPEDFDWADMRAESDDAVVGGRNADEAARRLAILMQDEDLWNDFAPERPEEMAPLDADSRNREFAFNRVESELREWFEATYPEANE